MRPLRTAPPPVAEPPVRRVPPPPSRPTWFDYLLLPAGFALSVLLAALANVQAVPTAETPATAYPALVQILPQWLFLPVGVILLWPVFHTTQRLAGRSQALTSGEWLLGLAWLAALVLAGGVLLQYTGTLPGFLSEGFREWLIVGHLLGALALAVLAGLLLVLDLAARWDQPWTHRLGLGLLLWQLVPLGLGWAWHIQFA